MTANPRRLGYVVPMQRPPNQTFERWAWDYLHTDELAEKLSPPPLRSLSWEKDPVARNITTPSRPGLEVATKSPKSPKMGALVQPKKRAQLFHTFFHHELQAAELMCWACLRFVDTPQELRRGLLAICGDEIRHMHMYKRHIEELGFAIGSFPVRDWFWERVPSCTSAASFLATMGIGFEGANLDHAERYAEWFHHAGDLRAARLQRQVCEEEVAHVRFAVRWLTALTGSSDFASWQTQLPAPLSPMLMHGAKLNLEARTRAGMTATFLGKLASYAPR